MDIRLSIGRFLVSLGHKLTPRPTILDDFTDAELGREMRSAALSIQKFGPEFIGEKAEVLSIRMLILCTAATLLLICAAENGEFTVETGGGGILSIKRAVLGEEETA